MKSRKTVLSVIRLIARTVGVDLPKNFGQHRPSAVGGCNVITQHLVGERVGKELLDGLEQLVPAGTTRRDPAFVAITERAAEDVDGLVQEALELGVLEQARKRSRRAAKAEMESAKPARKKVARTSGRKKAAQADLHAAINKRGALSKEQRTLLADALGL